MTAVRPTLNKYFEIAASSFGLLAVLLRQQLEKTHRRRTVHLHLENYLKMPCPVKTPTLVDDKKVNNYVSWWHRQRVEREIAFAPRSRHICLIGSLMFCSSELASDPPQRV